MTCRYLDFQALGPVVELVDKMHFQNRLVDRRMDLRAVIVKSNSGDSSLCMTATPILPHLVFDAGIIGIAIELQDHVPIPRHSRLILELLAPVDSDSKLFVISAVFGPHAGAILSRSYISVYLFEKILEPYLMSIIGELNKSYTNFFEFLHYRFTDECCGSFSVTESG